MKRFVALAAALTMSVLASTAPAAATPRGQSPRPDAETAASTPRGQSPRRDSETAASVPTVAAPDQVIQWNHELLTLLQTPGAQPATIHPTRTLAIVQLAVYDAVDAIQGGHRPYLPARPGPAHASASAAVAAAARTSLLALLPSQHSAIDATYEASLAQLGHGSAVRQGIRVGERAAQAILAARVNDGSQLPAPAFVPGMGPGAYQATPPAFSAPVFGQWPKVTPFALRAADQFRPPPPPAPGSARYVDDFNEVKSLGRVDSTTRSAEQTEIGRFWGAAPIWIVWNQIAEMAAPPFHNTLGQNARMFALLDTSLADSVIGMYDGKYAYNEWRPITAITALDTGNPLAVSDPTWTPLAPTAPDPSYPGAHATVSEAAAVTLADFFGTDSFAFSLTNASLPGVVRSFGSFSQAADEASASRIFAGQHFRFDEDAGLALGRQVADFVDHNLLLPSAGRASMSRTPRHHGRNHRGRR